MNQATTIRKRIADSIYGFIVGDCYGVPYEFSQPGKRSPEMVGHGTHDQPPGTFSDDTSLLLATLDADMGNILSVQNNFKEFLKGKYTCDGVVFDVGKQTKTEILKFGDEIHVANSTIEENGNGSLMRMIPAAIHLLHEERDDVIYMYVKKLSSITHSHEISVKCCFEYVKMLIAMYNGRTYRPNVDFSIDTGGYVGGTLKIAIESLNHNLDYKNSIMRICAMGGDTDTNCAVAGSLLAINNKIPAKMLKAIRNKEYINSIIERYVK